MLPRMMDGQLGIHHQLRPVCRGGDSIPLFRRTITNGGIGPGHTAVAGGPYVATMRSCRQLRPVC